MKISLLSSSTAGLLSIFTIIILLTSANLVRADIAPPPFPKAAGIYPNGVSTEVRMVSEVVDITIIDQVSQDFPDGHARVKAIFQMLNLGTALEKMDVYFPLDWDKCEQDVTKMRLYEFKRNPTMRYFHVLVGGTEVPFTTLYQRLRAEMSTYPQETDVACWIYFPTLFPVGKTVTIEVNYQTPAEARWGKDYP